jgi:hypothetical protein
MPSQATNDATRREWRELGFFYDRDDAAKTWRLVGSRSSLLRFRDLLLACAANESNAPESEHQHCGPYMNLEIMTWHEAGFDDHSIHGPLSELKRLGEIIEQKLLVTKPGKTILIQSEFATKFKANLQPTALTRSSSMSVRTASIRPERIRSYER